jgi:hypothetical protein
MESNHQHDTDNDIIDLREILIRLRRGLTATIGLGLLGLALGVVIALVIAFLQPAPSTLRVAFSFKGFEHGNYPNGTNFTADDIRAPDVITDALKKSGDPADSDLSSRIRGAITINGLVPDTIIKERDKLRAAGENPPVYVPDEYAVTLALGRDFKLTDSQREHLLTEIISTYSDKFRRTYIDLPREFDNPFDALRDADYPEYELVLNRAMESLISYLHEEAATAGTFRSPTNGLSFQSLINQAEIFSRVRLNDTLSLIYIDGLTKNRAFALTKMNYYLRTLEDQEQRLQEQQSVVTDLLKQTGDRTQNYVLASKTQLASDKPVIDQGLIDSLMANDSYNLLVRKALSAGTALKDVQADKARLLERKARMESFAKGEVQDQASALAEVRQSLTNLETDYAKLLGNVRTVLRDYTQQEYGHAIRITQPPKTPAWWKMPLMAALVGLLVGAALGVGLSLLKQAEPHT